MTAWYSRARSPLRSSTSSSRETEEVLMDSVCLFAIQFSWLTCVERSAVRPVFAAVTAKSLRLNEVRSGAILLRLLVLLFDDGLDGLALFFNELAAEPTRVEHETAAGKREDASQHARSPPELVAANSKDIAGHEQGGDDRVPDAMPGRNGVTGLASSWNVAVIVQASQNRAGRAHQTHSHADAGAVIVAPPAGHQAHRIRYVADGPSTQWEGDDRGMKAVADEFLALIHEIH